LLAELERSAETPTPIAKDGADSPPLRFLSWPARAEIDRTPTALLQACV